MTPRARCRLATKSLSTRIWSSLFFGVVILGAQSSGLSYDPFCVNPTLVPQHVLGAVLYGMTQQQLIIFMIIVQITSIAGAYLFGLIAEKLGCKRSLIGALLLMLVAVSWLFWNQTTLGFFGIGALAGFALTGVQSVSRAMVGSFSPPGQSASFYGMFAVAGRTSSFIGPTVFGWLAASATRRYLAQGQTDLVAEQLGHRAAVLSIAAFLIAGLVVLLTVNEREGRADALKQS